MAPTITIEVPASHEAQVRRFLAFLEELENLADTAPDGTVLDACERVVVEKGRDINKQILAGAVARRVSAAEKKGYLSASANAAVPKKTAVPRTGKS
jgi:hypothetical protein